jgi:biopolymer transport protein ExbD
VAVKIKKGSSGGIDMTPMIDVVFQLMIFFLVATKLEEAERELAIALPQASEAAPLTIKPKEIFINIDRTGRVVVSGQLMTENDLDGFLAQAATNNPGTQRVIIRSDRDAAHKYFTAVVNLCQKHNIRDFGLATAEPDD